MLLKEICDFANGKGIKITQNGKYPIVGSASVIGYTNCCNINNPVVCIGRVGSVGVLQYITSKCWITDNVIICSPHSGFSARYIYYLLSTMSLQHYKIGTTQPLLTIGIVSSLDFSPSSIPLQQHIVDTI